VPLPFFYIFPPNRFLHQMASLVIKSYPGNSRVLKSKLTGLFNGVTVTEDNNVEFGKTNKEESFLKVNPFGQIPTLFQGSEGVFESNSICRYIARLGEGKKKLYGNNALEASRIDAFLDAECSFAPYLSYWAYPYLGYAAFDEAKIKDGKERVKKYLLGLNRALEGQEYLVNNTLSIADLVWFCALVGPNAALFTEDYLKDVPNVTAWFKRIHQLPGVAALADPVAEGYKKQVEEAKKKQQQ